MPAIILIVQGHYPTAAPRPIPQRVHSVEVSSCPFPCPCRLQRRDHWSGSARQLWLPVFWPSGSDGLSAQDYTMFSCSFTESESIVRGNCSGRPRMPHEYTNGAWPRCPSVVRSRRFSAVPPIRGRPRPPEHRTASIPLAWPSGRPESFPLQLPLGFTGRRKRGIIGSDTVRVTAIRCGGGWSSTIPGGGGKNGHTWISMDSQFQDRLVSGWVGPAICPTGRPRRQKTRPGRTPYVALASAVL